MDLFFTTTDDENQCTNFEIIFPPGFFKPFMDIVSTGFCIPGSYDCLFSFNKNGLYIGKDIEKDDIIRIYLSLFIESTKFISYKIKKNITLQLEPKTMHGICRNIRKTDAVIMSYNGGCLDLIMKNYDEINHITREEKKSVKVLCFPPKVELINDIIFLPSDFNIIPEELENFKRGVNSKDEMIEICIQKYKIDFNTRSTNNRPIHVSLTHKLYNNLEIDKSIVYITGRTIAILGKLGNLSKVLNFHRHSDNNNIIKITSIFDKFDNIGKIELIVNKL